MFTFDFWQQHTSAVQVVGETVAAHVDWLLQTYTNFIYK